LVRLKIKTAVVLPLALILLFLSYDKAAVFFKLAKYALQSEKKRESDFISLARDSFRNPRLFPLLEENARSKDLLALWVTEYIRYAEKEGPASGSAGLVSLAAQQFPENVILSSLQFYPEERPAPDWENFDRLFFRVLEDPELNALSLRTLKESFLDGRIPPDKLRLLLPYLTWAGNRRLAEDLWNWGMGEKTVRPVLSGSLDRDLYPKSDEVQPDSTSEEAGIWKVAGRLLGVNSDEIGRGEDLIPDGHFWELDAFPRGWEFSDMADQKPFAKGSFYGGFDSAAGNSLRVMGFFAQADPDKIPCRAGFWLKESIAVRPRTYLFSFRYMTLGRTERPSFWLASPEYVLEKELESSPLVWSQCVYVFNNRELGIPEVRPLLRMWGTGAVWFDDIHLFEIEFGEQPRHKELIVCE
jgi:hypothetical protein